MICCVKNCAWKLNERGFLPSTSKDCLPAAVPVCRRGSRVVASYDADDNAKELYDKYYSTRRLRDMSRRIRGSKHGDLWHCLSLVFAALGKNDGRPQLGLIGLGSFLWRSDSTKDILGPSQTANSDDDRTVHITNDDLLLAIRSLAYTEQINPANGRLPQLGLRELGSVYESLLELHRSCTSRRNRSPSIRQPEMNARQRAATNTLIRWFNAYLIPLWSQLSKND